jgi:hypothetical protein
VRIEVVGMDAFRFTRNPAWLTLGDGVGLAGSYLKDTWQRWLPPVLGLAVVEAIVGLLLQSRSAAFTYPNSFSSRPTPSDFGQFFAIVGGGSLIITIIGIVLSWYLTAVAIHGLRGRPITTDWVVGAGLRAFGASLLMLGAWILAVVAFIFISLITGWLGLLLGFLLSPVAVYVMVRLYFWTLAIFDGAGVMEGGRVSWMLTRGAVLRMLGWGLAVIGIMILVGIGSSILSLALRPLPLIEEFFSSLLSLTMSVFTTYLLAVLYESQRWIVAPPQQPAAQVVFVPPVLHAATGSSQAGLVAGIVLGLLLLALIGWSMGDAAHPRAFVRAERRRLDRLAVGPIVLVQPAVQRRQGRRPLSSAASTVTYS